MQGLSCDCFRGIPLLDAASVLGKTSLVVAGCPRLRGAPKEIACIPLHVLQHACFFVSAFAFWWAVFGRRAPDATWVACLFTTMLHTSALAVLLTFAPVPWYAHDAAIPLGLTALEDQQLGGLVMWVPGAFAYVVAKLAIIAGWLRQPRAHRNVT